MTVYAPTPGFADRRSHPRALLLIVAGHAALIAAVMTAKMGLPPRFDPVDTVVTLIDPPKPPPEPAPPPRPTPRRQPAASQVDLVRPVLPIPRPDGPAVDPRPMPIPDPGAMIGNGVEPIPSPLIVPQPAPVRVAARFATPDWALKPPYPDDKRRLEEEAVLRLRLSIDERGRVVAVEPIGAADRSFLEAARRHLLAKWRYKPATEDGRPVPSSTVITLRFELE